MEDSREQPPGPAEPPATLHSPGATSPPPAPQQPPPASEQPPGHEPPAPASDGEPPLPEDGPERPKASEEDAVASGEKEEEEAFLVSLYKFMKERHTPIERIPHLGFKQINLWKIYKAVEKLGAYELVTGRRLWKNVYDELGGSPGSTSAATCTRRHYERLVLPYVRHLKGEDDKPLPPSKPRKQYKVSKGAETGEKSRRSKKEKGREQILPEKAKPEAVATPGGSKEEPAEAPERGRPAEGRASPAAPAPSPSAGCAGTCRAHAEAYKRLFSSFYSKGNHPIMSPLAKKKLLAQVSKAESLHCHKRHCPEGRRGASDAHPSTSPEPPRPAEEQRSPEPPGFKDPSRGGRSETGSVPSASPGGRDSQPYPRAEDGGPAPTVFTGYFHAYHNKVLKPVSCHPLGGYFSSLKDFLEPQPEDTEQPQDLRSKAGQAWSGEGPRAAAFTAVKSCRVPPGAGFAPPTQSPTVPGGKRSREEEAFGPSKKLRAVSPFVKEPEGRDKGAGSPGGQPVLAKPKAIVPGPGYAAPLPAVPPAPDGYKGAMLRFPPFDSRLHAALRPVPAAGDRPRALPRVLRELAAAPALPRGDVAQPNLLHHPTRVSLPPQCQAVGFSPRSGPASSPQRWPWGCCGGRSPSLLQSRRIPRQRRAELDCVIFTPDLRAVCI
uniref:Cyclin and CBS domain divalent metal cation transport mediator 4 n=1 Tax=Cairina moschata TaxID=8855 RepID=A0A8C3GLG7_CAIMO